MEETSDILNSGSSNLRDLIMQKLSAAREQKLKQNKSSATLPTASKLLTTQSVNPWEEEKQLLLSMLEKSQNSASQIIHERKSLENTLNSLNQQINRLTHENSQLRNELERAWTKSPNSKTEGFMNDQLVKVELVSPPSEIRENALKETIKEKEKEIEKLKKLIRSSKGMNDKAEIASLADLKAEKDRILKGSAEKESQLTEEILKLKFSNNQLLETFTSKEKSLKDQISTLTQEINHLKKQLTDLNQEKKDLNFQSEELTLFYKLKADLLKSHETISQQEQMIQQLKAAALQSLDTIPSKEKKNDLKSSIQSLQKEFSDFSQKFKLSEDNQLLNFTQKNSELTSLQNEITELRHKLIVYESKKYENELMLIRADLHKSVAEKAHSKKLVISYIRSVQQLEKMINERVDAQSTSQMYMAEISRLNDENKSLVEIRQKQEEFYEAEIKGLQVMIDEKNLRIHEIENKLDTLCKSRGKEANDEIKAWVLKNKQLQEINKKIIDSLSGIEIKSTQGSGNKRNQQKIILEGKNTYKMI